MPITSFEFIKGYAQSKVAKGETNDCVVRALAVVEDCDYDTAHRLAATRMRRANRKGVHTLTIVKYFEGEREKYELVKTESNPYKTPMFAHHFIVEGKALKTTYKLKGKEIKCDMTLGTFAKRYNRGRYFVVVRGHALAVVDGQIIGNNEDPTRTRRPVRFAYEAKRATY